MKFVKIYKLNIKLNMNKEINKINKMVDVLDECAMLYFDGTTDTEKENTDVSNYNTEKLHTNFYECLIKILRLFLSDKEELDIYDEELIKKINDKLDDLENYIEKTGFTKEEILQALLLLDIKGFKNLNFDLSIITPNAVSLIFAAILSRIYDNTNKLTLFDPNIGTGNLIFNVACAFSNDVSILGIDSHSLMSRIACVKAEMLQIESEIYFDDCLSMIPTDISFIVSDIATYMYENDNVVSNLYHNDNVRYFPFLLIEHFLQIEKPILAWYLIDDDFFSQPSSSKLNEYLKQRGEIVSLIKLPIDFFQDSTKTKSILVISNKKVHEELSVNIYAIPSLSNNQSSNNQSSNNQSSNNQSLNKIKFKQTIDHIVNDISSYLELLNNYKN